MPTKLSLYNQALSHMKATRLAAVDEDVENRHALDVHYDDALRFLIEQGFWKFAMRTVEITYDPDVAPAFGFSRAFNIPDDLVTVYQVSASDQLTPPLERWIRESNLFWADVDPIYVRYVSNSDDGYGYDLDTWSARFILAFTYELAWRTQPSIAGSSESMVERLEKDKVKYLLEALAYEALKEPAERPPVGNWVRSRFRGSGNRRYDRAP